MGPDPFEFVNANLATWRHWRAPDRQFGEIFFFAFLDELGNFKHFEAIFFFAKLATAILATWRQTRTFWSFVVFLYMAPDILEPLVCPYVDRYKNPKMTNFSPLCILFYWRAFETWRYQKEFYRYFIRFNEKSFWTKNVVGFCIDFCRITYVFLLSRHEQVLKVGLFGALKSRLRLKLVMLSLVLKFLLMQC